MYNILTRHNLGIVYNQTPDSLILQVGLQRLDFKLSEQLKERVPRFSLTWIEKGLRPISLNIFINSFLIFSLTWIEKGLRHELSFVFNIYKIINFHWPELRRDWDISMWYVFVSITFPIFIDLNWEGIETY